MATLSLQARGYLPVATATLCPQTVMACDLYLQRRGCGFVELYRSASLPITAADIQKLREDGVEQLYIRLEEAEAYRAYLCEHVIHDPSIAAAVRMRALTEVTRVAFQDALVANQCGGMVAAAEQFGQHVASLLAERSVQFDELYSTLAHDYYTFTHVCNVSVYCTLIGQLLGMCDLEELAALASAALLHDIGKRHIPPHVLNKRGKLTDAEWDLVRQHPTTGFRELARREDLQWSQLMVVYQHHERLDGSGYPCGLTGNEIDPWARICAVADVFDALTCQRPYRQPLPVAEVCEHLEQFAGQRFDPQVVAAWCSHVRRGA
jgi:HD-GYP domain-containing protein (c-di-GMP phosphodiesterase class II)